VHRLDRGTSGVMVSRRTTPRTGAVASISRSRSREGVHRAVWGVVQAGRRIDAAIGRDPGQPAEDVARDRAARARRSPHHESVPPAGLTLCQVAIHTGRTHQIRVHLSAIGHPIVGTRSTAVSTAGLPGTSAPSLICSGRSCTRRDSCSPPA
jgi:23S rRNA-/tRNA-specific pseudouridylate synthase